MNKGVFNGGWDQRVPTEFVIADIYPADYGTDASNDRITFVDVPMVFESLYFTFALRSTVAATSDTVYLQFNDDSGTNYSLETLDGQATTITATETLNTATPTIIKIPGSTAPADSFAMGFIDMPFYSEDVYLDVRQARAEYLTRIDTLSGETEFWMHGLTWQPGTFAPIRKIDFVLTSGSWAVQSRMTMYGKGHRR